jgi:hypothetical protein
MNEMPTDPAEIISPIARLFQKARQQGHLSYDEILEEIPHPDIVLEQLDRLFAALLAAGIPYGDEEAESTQNKL